MRTLIFLVMMNIICLSSSEKQPKEPKRGRPNIIFILADDLGANDVGFQGNSQMPTPELNLLAKKGVVLSHHYTHHLCTPTRSAALTGRYAMRFGLQRGVIFPAYPYGIPLDEVLYPQILRDQYNYATHMVGKWHCGYFDPRYLPTSRGFDSFKGIYLAKTDHITRMIGASVSECLPIDTNDLESELKNTSNLSNMFTGYNWADDTPNGFTVSHDDEGVFSSEALGDEAVSIIQNHHVNSKPLFLWLAFQSVHIPLQLDTEHFPPECMQYPVSERQILCSMVNGIDAAVGRVVNALKEKGMYENTVIIFTSDNGGNGTQSSNFPLRGLKNTYLEGGVRVPTFVHAPGRIHSPGSTRNGKVHVVDWFPTILHLAANGDDDDDNVGANLNDDNHHDDPRDTKIDGKNIWSFVAKGNPSPRKELLVGIDQIGDFVNGALIVDHWKLFLNDPGAPTVSTPNADCYTTDGFVLPPPIEPCPFPLNSDGIALIDLEADPNETTNVADQHPEIVKFMLERLELYRKASVPPLFGMSCDPRSDPALHDGNWVPWVNVN